MQAHLRRHHLNIDISSKRKKPQKQETFPTDFRMKLQANSDRAQTINVTKAIGVFMALDMRPFSVVENDGFTYLLSVGAKIPITEPTAFQSECAASPLQRSKSQTSEGPEQC